MNERGDQSYNKVLNIRERGGALETARDVVAYARLFGFERKGDFVDYLKKHRSILDLGSGLGMFARDVARLILEAERPMVVSMNPRIVDGETRLLNRKKADDIARVRWRVEPDEEIERLQKFYDKGAVAARWPDFPFKNCSFDLILSSFAFPIYAKTRDEVEEVCREVWRIAKPGAEIIFAGYNRKVEDVRSFDAVERYFSDVLKADRVPVANSCYDSKGLYIGFLKPNE